jgi:hypothetical protein
MPTITDNQGSRYRTAKQLRNDPRDDLEREYRDTLASEQAGRILDRFPNEPEFQKELVLALSKKVFGERVPGDVE